MQMKICFQEPFVKIMNGHSFFFLVYSRVRQKKKGMGVDMRQMSKTRCETGTSLIHGNC